MLEPKVRFERHFKKAKGCWEWKGAKIIKGLPYGLFRLTSSEPMKLAHRVSYSLYVGPLTDDLEVLHTCDNPKCVNPTHLELGTTTANIHDCLKKGRSGQSTFNERTVKSIRSEFDKLIISGYRRTKAMNILASKYNRAVKTIRKLINGHSWKFVL